MDTTILVVEQLRDRQTADRLRRLLDGEPGVTGVVALEEYGEIYVKHNPARAPYRRLLERLEGEGYRARVKS